MRAYPDRRDPMPAPRSVAHGVKNAACLTVYLFFAGFVAVHAGLV